MDKECEQKDEMSQESVKTEGGRLMRDPQHGVLGGVLAVVLFLASQWLVRPLSDDERDVIAKFVPRRWILW